MSNKLAEQYRKYKHDGDRIAGDELCGLFYKQLSYWIEFGKPVPGFVDEFWELYIELQEPQGPPQDLIDLGLFQTAEAITGYRQENSNENMLSFFLHEARLPFFAYMDENGYRLIKNLEFSEIDFQIFEVIQGTFPHDAAQNFLVDNEWADIWTVLRYMDSIDEDIQRWQIIETLMEKRKTIHEKLIFFAYLLFTEGDSLRPMLTEQIGFPEDLQGDVLDSVFFLMGPFLESRDLDLNWEDRIHPSFEKELIFFLLSFFEVAQCDLSPGWIRLLERSLEIVWDYPFADQEGAIREHQPIQEFLASILGIFSEGDLQYLLDTSLLYPLFFENLEQYKSDALQSLLGVFVRYEDKTLHELSIVLPDSLREDRLNLYTEGPYQEIARVLGHEIQVKNGIPHLLNVDGMVN